MRKKRISASHENEEPVRLLGRLNAEVSYRFAVIGDDTSRNAFLNGILLPNRWAQDGMTIADQLQVTLTGLEERFRKHLNLAELEWAASEIWRYAKSPRYPVEMIFRRIKKQIQDQVVEMPRGWRQKQKILRNLTFKENAIDSFAEIPAKWPVSWIYFRSLWVFEKAEGRSRQEPLDDDDEEDQDD